MDASFLSLRMDGVGILRIVLGSFGTTADFAKLISPSLHDYIPCPGPDGQNPQDWIKTPAGFLR
jgi:hypothetical protein